MTAAALIVSFSASAAQPQKTASQPLPAPIRTALTKYKIPASQLSVTVIPLTGKTGALNYNGSVKRTPASIEKVITSAAALEILGPQKSWHTRALADSEPDAKGELDSDIYIIGTGDPDLSLDGIWRMLDNMRARGVKTINGNLVIDRSRFKVPPHDPFAFDGEGNRPYNLGPDAFLVNSRALVIQIRPDKASGTAKLYAVPNIHSIKLPESIPLSREGCSSWRKQIKPDFSNPLAPKFNGKFPLSCGNKDFFYTSMNPEQYLTTVFTDYWKKLGGTWNGKVTEGTVPGNKDNLVILGGTSSDPLAKIIYEMNKYSINPIARQVFLLLGQNQKDEPKTLETSRSTIADWLAKKGINPKDFYLENGSGLSRESYITTESLTKLLAAMWKSNVMPEYIASLPISGVDGTMRKRHPADGFAHIKTGYLSTSRTIAGYVKSKSGDYYAVTAVVNGSGANASVPVLDAVISWIHRR